MSNRSKIKLKPPPPIEQWVIQELRQQHHQTDRWFTEVIHLSDVHIPLNLHLDRKDEYLSVFNRLYTSIQKRIDDDPLNCKPLIVLTGDLLHVKENLQSETIVLCRNFLGSLANLAETVIIIGNHDFTENNVEKMDTMTAVCHGINVHCLKYSGVYQIGQVVLSFSSLFDKKFIYHNQIPKTENPIYALYHGTVLGSVNCNGTVNNVSHNQKSYPNFASFNGYAGILLGHVHKHQLLTPHMAYAGSLIQQNFGEEIDGHGYLVWNLETHTPTFYPIENDYVFFDLYIKNGLIVNQNVLDMYKDKKLRIRCKNQATNASQYNQIVTDLKANYHIHEIRTGKPLDPGTIVKTLSVAGTEVETIRDLHQLEIDLIKKHAKPNLCEEVLKLHAKYKAVNEVKPSAWNIRSLRFMNVFAYGGDHVNTIDFINGIHNLCSPNMTGKSSIVNVIVYALFEKTSQNSSSKIDIVHVGKTEAFIELVFEHNGTGYLIEKTAKLKKKKLGFETNFYQLGDMLSPITPLLSGDSMSPTRKLLNGKDSIQSIAEITNYIGDFESFTTHNIISTKLGSSLIQMSPADKLRHFQKLSKTDQYEDYMKIVKESLKTEETELTQLQARLVKLDSETKGIDIDLEKANVCQYKRQNQASVEQLSILIKTGMDISTEIGTHTARIETLQSQIEVVGQVPTKTLEQATMTLQKNNQKITESTAIDEGSSSMGIKAMIKNYQAQIKPCGDCVNGDCDIENQPTETLKDLQSQKLQLQHQIKVNQDLVKKLKPSTEPSILDFADLMSLKATLTDSLNNKMKPKITINQCKNQIAQIMISQMKVPEEADPNLIRNQLAVKRHELKELQKVLKDYEDILLIETQLDLLRLSDSVRPVEKKIKVETHNLVAKRGPDQTQAQSIIDGLIFKDGLAEIKEEDAKYLSQFIEMSSDIEFLKSEKAKMQRQHNLEVDANIKHNQEIEAQIRWVEKSNLESQMVTLGLAIAYLSETLRYTELNTQLHDLEIFEKIEQIDRQLDLIQFNKYKQLITDDEGTVATIDWTIQWYQKMENLEIQKENHRYQELIEKNQELLAVALLKENNKILTGIIKYWDLVKKNHEIETLIEEANHDLENCQTALKTNQEAILKNQKEDIVIQKKIVILENKVNKYQESLEEIGVLHEKIKVLVEKVDTDTEYVRLFNRNSIPFEIMNFKLTSFNLNVNQIFEPYTKYSFKYEQNDASKLVFLVTNRTSGLVIDPERLSGFESVILQLAINNATLSIADNFRCGFMIIDESMDCLDQTNFNEKLPQMIEALRQYYQNVILISHREIPASIVDKQLRISHYGTYSTINS